MWDRMAFSLEKLRWELLPEGQRWEIADTEILPPQWSEAADASRQAEVLHWVYTLRTRPNFSSQVPSPLLIQI